MMPSRRGGALLVAGLTGVVCLIAGLVPVLFLDAARRAGSIGKLSPIGLATMTAAVMVIAASAGVALYRAAIRSKTRAADLWVASFLAIVTWSAGVLTLVPGLVFLRLSDNRSLNDHGARFFLEWALLYVLIAAAAYASARWSLQSLSKVPTPQPAGGASTST
jgi:hypothetical protein